MRDGARLTIGGLPVQAADEHFSISRVSYMSITQQQNNPSSVISVRACLCARKSRKYMSTSRIASRVRNLQPFGDAQYESLVVKRVLARHFDTARSCLNSTQRLHCPSGVVLHFGRSASLHMPSLQTRLPRLTTRGLVHYRHRQLELGTPRKRAYASWNRQDDAACMLRSTELHACWPL